MSKSLISYQQLYALAEDTIASLTCTKDKKHFIFFEEISEKILRNFPEQNKKQLKQLDDNFFDCICYWNEKYYRNGFCDGMQLIGGCLGE